MALLAVILGLGLSLTGTPEAVAQGRRSSVLRLGVVKTLFRDTPEWLVQVKMRPFKALLQTQTGMTGELVLAGDAFALSQKLKDDKVQLGVFHGIEYAWARQKDPNVLPLVMAVNDQRALRAYLVVRRDSKAKAPANLEGKALALPEDSREHCRLFLERRCVRAGSTSARFYSRVTAPRKIEGAIEDLLDGTVQAAVVDQTAFEAYRKDNPGRARRVKVLLRSEAFPCGVIAFYRGHITPGKLRRFRTGLGEARNSPRSRQLLRLLRLTGFETVPAGYEKTFDAIVKAYPAPKPR
jgi:ABC-type phosphate/phosphonate transport system substrate-binding protein